MHFFLQITTLRAILAVCRQFYWSVNRKHVYNADEMDRKPVTTHLTLLLKWVQNPFSSIDAIANADAIAQCA